MRTFGYGDRCRVTALMGDADDGESLRYSLLGKVGTCVFASSDSCMLEFDGKVLAFFTVSELDLAETE